MDIRGLGEYISMQTKFRDSVGVELDLTQNQIAKLEKYLSSYNDNNSYFPVGNNCGEPIETTLQNFGYDVGDYIFPVPLFLDIHNSGVVKNSFNILKD